MLNQAPQAAPAVTETPVAPVTPAPVAPEAAPVVETPPVEAEKEQKEDPKFASRFAALTRKEQAIRARENSVKERESKYTSYEEEMKIAEANPLAWLEKRGYTFDKLTQLALNDGKKPADMQIQELREQLQREKEENEKKAAEDAKKDVETKTQRFLSGVDEFLTAQSETYELLRTHDNGPQLVLDVMNEHQRVHGRILTVPEACEFIEKHFEAELDNKYGKLKKIQKKFGKAEEAPAAPPASPEAPKAPSPTLTNSLSTAVATPSSQPVLNPEDSKREAAKLLKWT
jgi:hypothetical protein